MNLIYKDELITLDNAKDSINKIFELINEKMKDAELVFSHLFIDGIEVFEDFEDFIIEHLYSITTIEIVMKPKMVLIKETMESIQSYLDRSIPALEELVEEGYRNFSERTWSGINQLAEGMQWILQFMAITSELNNLPNNWPMILESIKKCQIGFTQLLEAIEDQDTILILDIISYEVKPAYELLEGELELAIRDEEFLKDVN
jgi:hypothetical protein